MEEPLLLTITAAPVRVVLNPSALAASSAPPVLLLRRRARPVGADRPMLPSQKERLLRGDGGGGEDDLAMFGHLWMLFCARLAQTKARNRPRDGRRRHFLWCGLWLGAVVFIVAQIIVANDAEIEQLLGFVAVGILTLLPLTIRFSDVAERQAQELVDEMAPLFAEEGFHVDLIAASSHTPMYVRFERASSSTISSSSPLQESMLKFQEQARCDHEDALIDQRQADLRENGLMPARICGIGVESLREWEFAIRTCTIIIGFVFVVCTVFTFLGYGHLLLDMSREWRTMRIKRRAVVEYSDDLDYTP